MFPRKVIHSNIGECVITEACIQMQRRNPDPSSIWVEHDGDMKEVTKALVTETDFYRASGDAVCDWCQKKLCDHPRYLKMDGNALLRQHCDGTVYKL